MNGWQLKELVKQRLPGYTDAEYLRECNDAYRILWEEILSLDQSYFTAIAILTVGTQAAEFDFRWNQNSNLSSAAIGPRFYKLSRIRVKQAIDNNWMSASPRVWNDPDLLAASQQTPQFPATTPPYFYTIFSDGSIQFARPLPVNTQIEVVYSFHWLPMVILNTGTIGTSSTAVAGVGTTFTQLVGPDYQTVLTGTGQDIEVAAELITGIPSIANTQQPWGYVIKSIASDTAMTAYTPIAPALASGTAYVLATIPDIPDTHQFAIASLATRNMMVTPGEDSRYTVWAGIAERDVQKLRDVVMERQIQEQVGRRRFPYGFARRGRFYGP